MKPVAVCISKVRENWLLPHIPFYCHTENYEPITRHDTSIERISYLTKRYNDAVNESLKLFPETDSILVIDSYYLKFKESVSSLIAHGLPDRILGAAVLFWEKTHVRPRIRYHDTLSVPEMNGTFWLSENDLPRGFVKASAVGGCFIFPRQVWERTGRFRIGKLEDGRIQAGSSRGLDTHGYEPMLDFSARVWRTKFDSPGIPEYSPVKRLRVSMGEFLGRWRKRGGTRSSLRRTD